MNQSTLNSSSSKQDWIGEVGAYGDQFFPIPPHNTLQKGLKKATHSLSYLQEKSNLSYFQVFTKETARTTTLTVSPHNYHTTPTIYPNLHLTSKRRGLRRSLQPLTLIDTLVTPLMLGKANQDTSPKSKTMVIAGDARVLHTSSRIPITASTFPIETPFLPCVDPPVAPSRKFMDLLHPPEAASDSQAAQDLPQAFMPPRNPRAEHLQPASPTSSTNQAITAEPTYYASLAPREPPEARSGSELDRQTQATSLLTCTTPRTMAHVSLGGNALFSPTSPLSGSRI